jgi:hypothetical protein
MEANGIDAALKNECKQNSRKQLFDRYQKFCKNHPELYSRMLNGFMET